MIPLYLDPAAARIALIGRGEIAARRLAWLRAGGAEPDVWSDAPEPVFADAAGASLRRGLPDSASLCAYHALWVADLPREIAAPLADAARASATIINVEDVKPLCDFHTPAVVRRGRLTLAAGTGGASPAAAQAARRTLERAFPEAWGAALDEVAAARETLRAAGAGWGELGDDARRRLAAHGLTETS